jgi:hypothetical protein
MLTEHNIYYLGDLYRFYIDEERNLHGVTRVFLNIVTTSIDYADVPEQVKLELLIKLNGR